MRAPIPESSVSNLPESFEAVSITSCYQSLVGLLYISVYNQLQASFRFFLVIEISILLFSCASRNTKRTILFLTTNTLQDRIGYRVTNNILAVNEGETSMVETWNMEQ